MQYAAGLFQPVLELFADYPYLVLFVGLLLAGEAVLLPALYLATTGRLDPAGVIAVAIVATLISDGLWYLLGRWYPAQALARIRARQSDAKVARLDTLFRRNGPRLLFLSKFVYGTRIAAQVLAGAAKMPYSVYMGVNVLGVATLVLCLAGLAWSVVETAEQLEALVSHIEVVFLLFVLLAVGLFIVVGTIVRKQWFR